MDCKEAEESLPAYALNALSPQEEALVEEHLDICPWCSTLLREHMQVAAALAQASERFQPSQELKDSTMRAAGEQLRQPRRPRRPLPIVGHLALGAVASIAVLLLAAVMAIGVLMYNQIDDLEQENSKLATQLSQLAGEDEKLIKMLLDQRSVSYVMASPDKQVLPLQGGEEVPKAEGMLMITARGGTGILMAKGLEPSSEDKTYHVWLEEDGQHVIVGLLSVDEGGWGVISLWPDQPITLFQQVGVTAGPAQDSAGPTTKPVLWGAIVP